MKRKIIWNLNQAPFFWLKMWSSLKLTKPLEIDGWNTVPVSFLGWSIFRGYVSFREGSSSNIHQLYIIEIRKINWNLNQKPQTSFPFWFKMLIFPIFQVVFVEQISHLVPGLGGLIWSRPPTEASPDLELGEIESSASPTWTLKPADVGALLLEIAVFCSIFFSKKACYLEVVIAWLPELLFFSLVVWLVGWLVVCWVGWVIPWIPCIPGHRANRRATEWPAMAKVGEKLRASFSLGFHGFIRSMVPKSHSQAPFGMC